MTASARFVLATANPHKATEIGEILAGVVELLPRLQEHLSGNTV